MLGAACAVGVLGAACEVGTAFAAGVLVTASVCLDQPDKVDNISIASNHWIELRLSASRARMFDRRGVADRIL